MKCSIFVTCAASWTILNQLETRHRWIQADAFDTQLALVIGAVGWDGSNSR